MRSGGYSVFGIGSWDSGAYSVLGIDSSNSSGIGAGTYMVGISSEDSRAYSSTLEIGS